MPIVRTDGCFRVTCSRCNKSMCFKCDPNKMIAYETSTECYNHLNTAHGGYWWYCIIMRNLDDLYVWYDFKL
jgi:hypothetical protein